MYTIDGLLDTIQQLQYTKAHAFYTEGMFASQRFHHWLPYYREDNNIYYPALIAYTLNDCLAYLNLAQKSKVQKIVQGIIQNYERYAKPSAPYLFNFYQTQPMRPYPNGFILSRFHYFILPEDADCTALITLTLPKVSSQQITTLRKHLINFANLSQKQAKYADAHYINLPAYGVWFGSGKMPIELDICVLCNILCLTFQQQLPLNEQDRASLEFIRIAIDTQDIMNKPFSLSSYYPNTTIILYHLARLCAAIHQPALHLPTQKIVTLLQIHLPLVNSQFEKLLLHIALIKMKAWPSNPALDTHALNKEFQNFPYFIASMPYDTPNRWLESVKNHRFFHIRYKSLAYYYALLLEYEVLKTTL